MNRTTWSLGAVLRVGHQPVGQPRALLPRWRRRDTCLPGTCSPPRCRVAYQQLGARAAAEEHVGVAVQQHGAARRAVDEVHQQVLRTRTAPAPRGAVAARQHLSIEAVVLECDSLTIWLTVRCRARDGDSERGPYDEDLFIHATDRSRYRRRVLRAAKRLHRPVRLLSQRPPRPLHGHGALHCAACARRHRMRARRPRRPAARLLLVQPFRRREPVADRRAVRGISPLEVHAARSDPRRGRSRRVFAGELVEPGLSWPHRAVRPPSRRCAAPQPPHHPVQAGARLA